MAAKFDKYLEQFQESLSMSDGILMSSLLSFRGSHAIPISKALQKVLGVVFHLMGRLEMYLNIFQLELKPHGRIY